MPTREFVRDYPSVSLALSIISVSMAFYFGSEGLSVLRPDHWITTLFYSSFGIMVFYALISKIRKKDLSQEFLIRFNVFLWFSTVLLSTRMLVRAANIGNPANPTGSLGIIPFNQLWIAGYHIHHYVFGLFLITGATLILLEKPDFSRTRAAIIFGSGLGLLFDEIGFLLSMGDYSSILTYPLALAVALLLFVNAYRPWKYLTPVLR